MVMSSVYIKFEAIDSTICAFSVNGFKWNLRARAAFTLGMGTSKPIAKLITKLKAKQARKPKIIAAMGISGGRSAIKFPVSESPKLISSAMMSAILIPVFRICFSTSAGMF